MANLHFLAFDLGAESGRAVLGKYDGSILTLDEISRFATRPETDLGPDGVRRWDFERIWGEIARSLHDTEQMVDLDGVGVDTWGVDFGLVDREGKLLEDPLHYRDDSFLHAMEQLAREVGQETIWSATGIQFMPFNTINQLRASVDRAPGLLGRSDALLFMPDLISSRLTGGAYRGAERTIASTSQMLDPSTQSWNVDLLREARIPVGLLPSVVPSGTRIGTTQGGTPVFATAGHDTASAIAAVPARPNTKWAFLSSGTWSLLGVELTAPVITRRALQMGLSNEVGINGTTRLLKNIMGLWLVQECRRSLANADQNFTYDELTALAAAAPPDGPTVDAVAQRFMAPTDMPTEIRNACTESGQPPPVGTPALIRCCLESLAVSYTQVLCDLEELLNTRFEALHIVGGGAKNRFLNQLTANRAGIPVIAGPFEAAAAGNILTQMIGAGVLADLGEVRTVSRRSFDPITFLPHRPGEDPAGKN